MEATTTVSSVRTTSATGEVKSQSKVTTHHAPQETVSISTAAQEVTKIETWVEMLKQMEMPQPSSAQGNPQEVVAQKVAEEIFFI